MTDELTTEMKEIARLKRVIDQLFKANGESHRERDRLLSEATHYREQRDEQKEMVKALADEIEKLLDLLSRSRDRLYVHQSATTKALVSDIEVALHRTPEPV